MPFVLGLCDNWSVTTVKTPIKTLLNDLGLFTLATHDLMIKGNQFVFVK